MKVFFNEDFIHYYWTRFESGEDVNEEALRDFIRQYKASDITDFLLNINGTVSSSESRVLETLTHKFLKTEENGVAVNFKDTRIAIIYDIFCRKGLDPYAIWVEELKSIGINPWLSFRMNDCHGNMEPEPNICRSEFVNANPSLWIAGNRGAIGYFDKCMNYLIPAVQDRMLSYIEEQLMRYDVYGIELDFMREAFCFPDGLEETGRAAMLSFFQRVKELTRKIGKLRSRTVKISMTCQASPISAYNCGFDIAELSRQGLVDFVVAGPRWDSINTDIPVGIWKSLLSDNTKIGCIQQLLVAPKMGWKKVMSTKDMAFGQAAAFASVGADIIYLYNYFDTVESPLNACYHSTSIRSAENVKYIVNNIGKTENISQFDRRCPLTFDDSVPLFEAMNFRLPLFVDTCEFKRLRIVTGSIEKEQRAYLNIAFKEKLNPEELDVYCNNQRAFPVAECMADKNIIWENTYTFEVSPWEGNSVVIALNSKSPCTAEYAEIYIEKIKEK